MKEDILNGNIEGFPVGASDGATLGLSDSTMLGVADSSELGKKRLQQKYITCRV